MRRDTNQKNDPMIAIRPPERINAATPTASTWPIAWSVQMPYMIATSQQNTATTRKMRASTFTTAP